MTHRFTSVFTLLCACSGSTLSSGKGVIGPAGGEVDASTSAAVTIPPGAVSSDITITLTPTEVMPPTDMVNVGPAYVFGPEGTQFAVPVTVTLEFDPSMVQAPTDAVIFTAPAGSTDYQALDTSVVDDSHVSALSTHFSVFVASAHKHHGMIDAGVLDAPIDAVPDAPAGCTPVAGPPQGQGCSFSATCNGHLYKIQCAGGSACVCTTDGGNALQVGNVGTTCLGTTGQPAWAACGFP